MPHGVVMTLCAIAVRLAINAERFIDGANEVICESILRRQAYQ